MNLHLQPLDSVVWVAARDELIAQLRLLPPLCRYCGEELSLGEAVPENGEMCTRCGGNKSPAAPMEEIEE